MHDIEDFTRPARNLDRENTAHRDRAWRFFQRPLNDPNIALEAGLERPLFGNDLCPIDRDENRLGDLIRYR
jgi:hypothetical protein